MKPNVFEHAASQANPDCPKCHGTGSYQYSTRGTPHFTICDKCCKHDMGFWRLTEHHSEPGKWCCYAGCGFTKDTHTKIESVCTKCRTEYVGIVPQCDWCPGYTIEQKAGNDDSNHTK